MSKLPEPPKPTVNHGFIKGAEYKCPDGTIWKFMGKGRPPLSMLEHFRKGGTAEELRVVPLKSTMPSEDSIADTKEKLCKLWEDLCLQFANPKKPATFDQAQRAHQLLAAYQTQYGYLQGLVVKPRVKTQASKSK